MKRLLLLNKTEVWAHWTVLPAVLFLTLTEGPRRVGLGLLALCLHEAGHLLTARGLGYRIRSLELWPFGAALATDVGPNLLPAEPLDGGRALAALLSGALGTRRARRLTAWTGLALGGGLLSLGIYGAFLGVGSETALVFSAFLLFSGARTLLGQDRPLEELIDRRSSLRLGRPVEVREAALYQDRTAGEALRSLRRGRYTLIRVIGRGDRLLGTLDEGALLQGLMQRGEAVTLGELVFLFDR